MARISESFGEAVRAVLVERGNLSQAQAEIKTGVDRATVGQMKNGYIPRLEQVERFARAFGLDVNEWRLSAGYEPIDADPEQILAELPKDELAQILGRFESPVQRFHRLLVAFMRHCGELGFEARIPMNSVGDKFATDEEADAVVRSIAEMAERDHPAKAKEISAWLSRELEEK